MPDDRNRRLAARPALRLYRSEDHAHLRGWCKARGLYAPPPEALPKIGAVALEPQGAPVGMAWLYMDNSTGMALLAWTTTAPGLPPRAAAAAVDALAEFLCAQAGRFGYGWVMALARGGLAGRLRRQGFFTNHSNLQQLLKRTD